MTETKTPTCERSDELISFFYGEANEHEAAQFEKHLQVCAHCQNEMSSFGQIRESIVSGLTHSAHIVASPPRTCFASSGVSVLSAGSGSET